MPNINGKLTGCTLNSLSRNQKNGTLKFRANLSKEFAKKMEWGDLAAGQNGADMEGSIVDATLILTAEQAQMFSGGEARMKVQNIGKFEITRLEAKNKRGKGFRFVLDFEAQFVEQGVGAIAESWIVQVGSGEATLVISGMLVEKTPDSEKESAS